MREELKERLASFSLQLARDAVESGVPITGETAAIISKFMTLARNMAVRHGSLQLHHVQHSASLGRDPRDVRQLEAVPIVAAANFGVQCQAHVRLKNTRAHMHTNNTNKQQMRCMNMYVVDSLSLSLSPACTEFIRKFHGNKQFSVQGKLTWSEPRGDFTMWRVPDKEGSIFESNEQWEKEDEEKMKEPRIDCYYFVPWHLLETESSWMKKAKSSEIKGAKAGEIAFL
jgi:hypothetical protein